MEKTSPPKHSSARAMRIVHPARSATVAATTLPKRNRKKNNNKKKNRKKRNGKKLREPLIKSMF